jgi:hypothetical protein
VRGLHIEDSERLERSIGTGLRKSGFALDIAGDGRNGLRFASTPLPGMPAAQARRSTFAGCASAR